MLAELIPLCLVKSARIAQCFRFSVREKLRFNYKVKVNLINVEKSIVLHSKI